MTWSCTKGFCMSYSMYSCCLDYEKSGKHVFMGEVETNVRQMLTFNGRAMDVIEPAKKAKSKSYVNSGVLVAGHPGIEHNPTFGDVSPANRLFAAYCAEKAVACTVYQRKMRDVFGNWCRLYCLQSRST